MFDLHLRDVVVMAGVMDACVYAYVLPSSLNYICGCSKYPHQCPPRSDLTPYDSRSNENGPVGHHHGTGAGAWGARLRSGGTESRL